MTVESGAIDSRSMFTSTLNLSELLISAYQQARTIPMGRETRDVEHVVIVARGINRLVGKALVALCWSATPVPVVVSSPVELPGFVSPSTLVFVVLDDEQTLRCADAASRIGANVVVIGSSHHARSFAISTDSPYLVVPEELNVARSSSALLVVSMLVLMERFGLFTDIDREIDATEVQLRLRREALVSGLGDIAGAIAPRLDRSFPLIYGVEGIGSVASMFWKAQANLNAKTPAFWGSEPEASSIEVAGFGQAGDVTRQLVTVVQLHSDFENRMVRSRADAAIELIREAVRDVIDVRAEGSTALAQFFDLLFTGEIVSLHLAARSGIDPGPTPVLEDIENAVANEPPMQFER